MTAAECSSPRAAEGWHRADCRTLIAAAIPPVCRTVTSGGHHLYRNPTSDELARWLAEKD